MLQSYRAHAISGAMENNSADTGAEQPRRRRHRSAVSNGNRLFTVEPLDGRTHMAMRFRVALLACHDSGSAPNQSSMPFATPPRIEPSTAFTASEAFFSSIRERNVGA